MIGFEENITRGSGLLAEEISAYRCVLLGGRSVYVEGVKGILGYTAEEVSVQLKKSRLKVCGSKLIIKELNAGVITVNGAIESISLF